MEKSNAIRFNYVNFQFNFALLWSVRYHSLSGTRSFCLQVCGTACYQPGQATWRIGSRVYVCWSVGNTKGKHNNDNNNNILNLMVFLCFLNEDIGNKLKRVKKKMGNKGNAVI
jgi:hypothetical protein